MSEVTPVTPIVTAALRTILGRARKGCLSLQLTAQGSQLIFMALGDCKPGSPAGPCAGKVHVFLSPNHLHQIHRITRQPEQANLTLQDKSGNLKPRPPAAHSPLWAPRSSLSPSGLHISCVLEAPGAAFCKHPVFLSLLCNSDLIGLGWDSAFRTSSKPPGCSQSAARVENGWPTLSYVIMSAGVFSRKELS